MLQGEWAYKLLALRNATFEPKVYHSLYMSTQIIEELPDVHTLAWAQGEVGRVVTCMVHLPRLVQWHAGLQFAYVHN